MRGRASSGRPTVRTPLGSQPLPPWDAVCFPEGPAGAPAGRNGTEATVRVPMYPTAVSVYADSAKIGVWVEDSSDNLILPRASATDYSAGKPEPSGDERLDGQRLPPRDDLWPTLRAGVEESCVRTASARAGEPERHVRRAGLESPRRSS